MLRTKLLAVTLLGIPLALMLSAAISVMTPNVAMANLQQPRNACVSSIADASNPTRCIAASSDPTIGMLYPLSKDLSVDSVGNVGVGTPTPSAALEVRGNFSKKLSGDLTIGAGTTKVIGAQTLFLTELEAGSALLIDEEIFVVDSIAHDTCLYVTNPATAAYVNAIGFTDEQALCVLSASGEKRLSINKKGELDIFGNTAIASDLCVDQNAIISGDLNVSGKIQGKITVDPHWESGWIAVQASSTPTFGHGLNDFPSQIQIWFSPVPSPGPNDFIYPVTGSPWQSGNYWVEPFTRLSQTQIQFTTLDYVYAFYAGPAGWTHWTSGYYKVKLWR